VSLCSGNITEVAVQGLITLSRGEQVCKIKSFFLDR
jgi:hypothetical protein